MKLFLIKLDGQKTYVTAETLGEAILRWKELIAEHYNTSVSDADDPGSIELLAEDPELLL